MKLKSSNNKTFVFLGILTVLIVSLMAFDASTSVKKSKYAETPDFEQTTPLDLVQLTFSEKQYNKLKKKKEKAIRIGILETSDEDYVPATVTYNGVDFKAEVRLKGDWTDHLKGEKWSFRVKLKGDKTILGMRKFSLHHPKTRGYLHEWLYHKAIKQEGLIGLRYSFVEGAIHIKPNNSSNYITKPVGVYAIEETFDKRTIESNKRKESVILKFSEDYWWGEVKKGLEAGEESGIPYNKFMRSGIDYPIRAFGEAKVMQDPVMREYFELSRALLKGAREGNVVLSDVFDIKKLAMQNAIMNLFGAKHGNSIINVRFYYNPITSKLEPIAFDGNSGPKLSKYEHFNFLLNKEIKDSVYSKELAYAINKVAQPQFLEFLLNEHKIEMTKFQEILKAEFKFHGITVNNLRHNQNILKTELSRLAQVHTIEDQDIALASSSISPETIEIPEFSRWRLNQTTAEMLSDSFEGKKATKLSRKSTTASSFNVVSDITTSFGEQYEASIIVKKTKKGFFGLRIQGGYPNRVDAVFDLENGTLKGVKKAGDFENEKASIKNLGNGWYRCSLSGKINASDVRVVLGATSEKTNVLSWESATDNLCNVIIIPESLNVKQVVNQ